MARSNQCGRCHKRGGAPQGVGVVLDQALPVAGAISAAQVEVLAVAALCQSRHGLGPSVWCVIAWSPPARAPR